MILIEVLVVLMGVLMILSVLIFLDRETGANSRLRLLSALH